MDIYEYAMQMERDGESYYRELAEKTNYIGIRNILIMLADTERKHYNIFRKMRSDEKPQITGTEVLSNVKNIFIKMKEEKKFSDINISQIELYKKAQEIEKKSQNFYLEKANEVKENYQRKVFLKIAAEENKHYIILENIINFVSQPDKWLENAEWYHLDEY
jgi:rubrerythrin